MSKHTPGPWEVEYPETDHFDPRTGHYTTPSHYPTVLMDGGENYADVSGENNEANARLIAAAPDLLANLRELIDAMSKPGLQEHFLPSDYDRLHTARAAIAKATREETAESRSGYRRGQNGRATK